MENELRSGRESPGVAEQESEDLRLPGRLRFYAGSGNAPEHLKCLDMAKGAAEIEALRRQRDEYADALKAIAALGGNLPDDRLTLPTGPMDAAARGIMYVEARRIAGEALRKAGRA